MECNFFVPRIVESSGIELCHHHGDRPLVDSIQKVCHGHSLPTQDHGEPKKELCYHHRDSPTSNLRYHAIIMEISHSSIQLKRCARGTAFLPKIMESPRGSSAIIMEIGC